MPAQMEVMSRPNSNTATPVIAKIVIALAWLFYRPLLGITLLVIAGFLVWVFAFKGKDKLKELAAKAATK